MNGTRRNIRCAVHGQQPLVVKNPKRTQQVVVVEALKDVNKVAIEITWDDGIE
jgi:hypothetical protein